MKSRKIILAISLVLLFSAVFTVLGYALGLDSANDGLTVRAQDESGYDLPAKNAQIVTDYPADQYKLSKKLSAIPETLEAWVLIPASVGTSSAGPILGNYSFDNSYGEAFLNYEIASGRHPRIWWGDEFAKNHYDITFEGVTVPLDTWTHVTFVYDNDNGKVSCYLNGELAEEKYFYPAMDEGVLDYRFVLCGDQRMANSNYFKGALQDVAIFSDVRSATEIKSDYNGVSKTEEDLLCYYDIDADDIGKNIKDETGNGNDIIYSKTWLSESEMQAIRDSRTDFEADYSFAVFGDTQMMTHYYANTLDPMYQWVVDNKEEKKIVYSIGLGDITNKNGSIKFSKDENGNWIWADNGEYDEWDVAKQAISILNGKIPYSLVRGNHDITSSLDTFNQTFYDVEYFTSQFEGEKGGKYTDLKDANGNNLKDPVTGDKGADVNYVSYANTWCKYDFKYDEKGEEKTVSYLFVNLDYGASDEVLAWASDVIEAHPDHKVIVSTHCYLFADATTEDAGDSTPPSIMRDFMNNGDDMWREFVSKHKNIEMVLSGHITQNEIVYSRTNAYFEDGTVNTVTEMLINPQGFDYRLRSGMVAILSFDESAKKMAVEYYSPTRDAYYMTASQFVIDLNKSGNDPLEEAWDGTTMTAPEGEGTEGDPYLVNSPANLLWMSKKIIDNGGVAFAGKYFKQTADIDLDGKAIQSIGYYYLDRDHMSAFAGYYDGNGKVIKNGTIASVLGDHNFETYYGHGLFGAIYGAVIEDVTLENVEVVGRGVTGAIVGIAAAPEATESGIFEGFNIVSGCTVKDSVKIVTTLPEGTYTATELSDSPFKAGRVGGAVGVAMGALIEGTVCEADIKLGGDFTIAGGIVASAGLDTTVANSAFKGSITYVDSKETSIGGIVGIASPSAETEDAFGNSVTALGALNVSSSYTVSGTVIGKAPSDDIYTETDCYTEANADIDTAIAEIAARGAKKVWLIGSDAPAASLRGADKYLDTSAGIYYYYTDAWAQAGNLAFDSSSLETPYGTISSSDAASPIVVFEYKNGKWNFVDGFGTLAEATESARSKCGSSTSAKAAVYVRTDIVSQTKVSDNTNWSIGTIIFDLGGNKITQEYDYLFPAVAKFGSSTENNVDLYTSAGYYVVKNGSIEVGGDGLFNIKAYGEMYNKIANSDRYKTLNYTFADIDFSVKQGATFDSLFGEIKDDSTVGIVDDTEYSATEAEKMALNVTLDDNCTFDLTNAKDGVILFNANDTKYTGKPSGASYYYTNTIVKYNVGAVSVKAASADFTWYEVNEANGSSVEFSIDNNGNGVTLTVPSTVTPATAVDLPCSDGFAYALKQRSSDSEAGTVTYGLATLDTPYGNIPEDYQDASLYPIVTFKKTENGAWQFNKAYKDDTENGAFYDALLSDSRSATDPTMTYAVYIRADLETTLPSGNMCWNVARTIINLGGKTLTPKAQFLPAQAKYSASQYNAGAAGLPATWEITNGTIVLGKNGNYGLLKMDMLGGAGSGDRYYATTDAENYKTFNYNFKKINFVISKGSTINSITGTYTESTNVGLDAPLNVSDMLKKDKYYDASKALDESGKYVYNNGYPNKKMGVNISYDDDCTFDISGAAATASNPLNLFNANDSKYTGKPADASYYYTNTIVNITVGAVEITTGSANYKWYSCNSKNGSSVTFLKNANGEYATVVSASDPVGTNVPAVGGDVISPMYISDGLYRFTTVKTDVYGDISDSYKAYKYIVMLKNEDGTYTQSAGYNSYASAYNKARGLCYSTVGETAVIYFRADAVADGVNTNFLQANGKIIFDLNGFTLSEAEGKPLFRLYAKAITIGDKLTVYPLEVIVKDGNIKVGYCDGMFDEICAYGKDGAYCDTVTDDNYKVATFNFENVKFSMFENSTATSFFKYIDSATNTKKVSNMGLNVNFNSDCVIDITNAPEGFVLFDAHDDSTSDNFGTYYSTNSIVEISVFGCDVIAGDRSFKLYEVADNGSSVVFEKGEDGKYFTLTLPEGVDLPIASVNGGEHVGELVFVKLSSASDSVTYTLMPDSINNFAPKSNLTLETGFVYNIYIPETSLLTSLKINGEEIDASALPIENIDGKDYRKFTARFISYKSVADITVEATLTDGDNSYKASFALSILSYAESILDGRYTEEEKTLAKYMLAYARATYTYFTDKVT
ncbi:MAG: metallophosphoesterase, partial [Clostridia bacterium]|nr:metallophosphoesterase [Clostridia bacterium]